MFRFSEIFFHFQVFRNFKTFLDLLVQLRFILDEFSFLTATFDDDRLRVSVYEASFTDLRGDVSS